MRIFFTSIITLLFFVNSTGKATCQTRASYKRIQAPLNSYALESYRQNLWDAFPLSNGSINDFEGLFTNVEERKLDSIITNIERIKEVEIVIVTLDTNMVTKAKFNDFAIHLLDIWHIGKNVKNNGILICLSSGYRQMRISNNFGIERILSDIETQQIIDKYFIPSFQRRKYFKGTLNGLSALVNKIYNRLYLNMVRN
jgi:uncharacterized protein